MRLLIVEDQQKHLEDAMAAVLRLQKAFELQVRYASTLEAAMEQLDWAEVVVTDLFFPEKPGGPVEPKGSVEAKGYAERIAGIKLVSAAHAKGKTFMVCTSTYHHAKKTDPAHWWLLNNRFPKMVDAPRGKDREDEALEKDWTGAILSVIALSKVGAEKRAGTNLRPLHAYYREKTDANYQGDDQVAQTLRLYHSIPKDA